MPSNTVHVETTTPLWRLVAIAATCAAIAALAYYLNAIHHADDVATVAVITAGYTATFWAAKRPQQFAGRFGPFGKIATAVRESQADIRQWVMDRPLRAGALIVSGYGLLVVLAKHIVIAAIGALWNPWLAVTLGAAVGAIVAAPHMFTAIARRLAGKQGRSAPGAESGRLPGCGS
jgi:hypothetical protein